MFHLLLITIMQACNEFFRECFEKDDGSIDLIHEVIAGAGAGFCQGLTHKLIVYCLQLDIHFLQW